MALPVWSRASSSTKSKKGLARRPRNRSHQVVRKFKKKTLNASDGSGDRKSGPRLCALTVMCAELAVAIFAKQKTVENRSWAIPPARLTPGGTWVALHVGSHTYMPPRLRKHIRDAWDNDASRYPWKMDLSQKHTGACVPPRAIVGFIRLKGVHKLKRGERSENPWALGPLCWEIDRAVPLKKPVENVNGKLKMWQIDNEASISSSDKKRLYRTLRHIKKRRGLGCAKPRS